MAELSRKQFLISRENAAKLTSLTARYAISESELVRRAIEAYDASSAFEEEAEAMLSQVGQALAQATQAVDLANRRVTDLLNLLESGTDHADMVQKTRAEIANNPGWMDELSDLLTQGDAA